jgi:hypothetical protein
MGCCLLRDAACFVLLLTRAIACVLDVCWLVLLYVCRLCAVLLQEGIPEEYDVVYVGSLSVEVDTRDQDVSDTQ